MLQELKIKTSIDKASRKKIKNKKNVVAFGEARHGKAAELSVCLDFLVLLHQGKRTI